MDHRVLSGNKRSLDDLNADVAAAFALPEPVGTAAAATAAPAKPRRSGNGNLTNYQRKVICEFYRKSGGVMSQKDLAHWTKHEFGLKKTPAQSTISGILKRQHEFVNMSSQELGIKKRRVVAHPELDAALANWVIQCANRGITVQGDSTKDKAKFFAKQLQIPPNETPEFSNGWLHSFQLRHNFSFRKFNAEHHTSAEPTNAMGNTVTRRNVNNASNPNVLHYSGMEELLNETDKYELRNVFALEETAVLYTLPPTLNAIVEDPMRGKKRFVVSLATNADGSEKLQPLFVSHHEHPKCFRKKTAEQHELHYFWNNKAWMTGVIFSRWLQRLDFAMGAQKRRILLFINDAASHVVSHLDLKNVVVFMLVGDVARLFNPITTRLVTTFKKRFRYHHLSHAKEKVKQENASKESLFDVDVLQAMKWAASSWNEIAPETIRRAWMPSNLVRPRLEMDEHDLLQDSDEEKLDSKLEELVQELGLTDSVPMVEYLNDEMVAENTVHEEFFDSLDSSCDIPEDEIDDAVEETPGRNLSLQEKLKAFRDVIHVLKERPDTDDGAMNALRRVQEAILLENRQKEELTAGFASEDKNALDMSGNVATSAFDVDGQQHMDTAALLESSESSALSAASASLAESAMLTSASDAETRQQANDDFHAVI